MLAECVNEQLFAAKTMSETKFPSRRVQFSDTKYLALEQFVWNIKIFGHLE